MGEPGSSADEEKTRAPNHYEALELEKFAKINEMYSSGVPFFTKDSMRDIHQQLLKAKAGDTVSVLNLDGTKSDFKISVGEAYDDYDDPETESVLTETHIQYQAIQEYTRKYDTFYNMSFCPMHIGHFGDRRNKITKESSGRSKKLPDLPLEDAEEFFKTSLEKWESSEQCKQFRSVLASAKVPEGITKIVAFACGQFSRVTPEPRYSTSSARSGAQHALIFTLLDLLNKMNIGDPKMIKCYAQDPAYTATDKSLLEQAGVKVLNDPEAFLEVDESTAVLSFCPNVCVRQVVADIARPAMMIWDPIRWDENEWEGPPVTDPDSPRLKKMIKDFYEEYKMPDNDTGLFFTNVGSGGIYVRKPDALTSRL